MNAKTVKWITTLFVAAMLAAALSVPSEAQAPPDTHHKGNVYIEGKMCLGTEAGITGGACVILSDSPFVHILREESGGFDLLHLENDGPARIVIENTEAQIGGGWTTPVQWILNNSYAGKFRITDFDDGPAVTELELDTDGNLTITGTLTTSGSFLPDYVFEDDYPLLPMEDLAAFIKNNKHLPNLPAKAEVEETGMINMSELQLKLLEKVEELTLYTLNQEDAIKAQQKIILDLGERLTAVTKTLETTLAQQREECQPSTM